MANFANLVDDMLPGINQYEDIFNTLAQAIKITMEPTGNNADDNFNAATAVGGALIASGWNIRRINKDRIIADVTRRIIMLLRRYLDTQDPSERTENAIYDIINNLNNYLNNNIDNDDFDSDNDSESGSPGQPYNALGRRKRKSRKSRKTRKSRKSRKTRKH